MNVLWLQSGGCGGCSMSLLCADTTDFQGHLRDGGVNLLWHPSLSMASGEEVIALLHSVLDGGTRLDALCIEGSLLRGPNGSGRFHMLAGTGLPMIHWVRELAAKAKHVLAVGSCAAWGGITAGGDNPTDACGLQYEDDRIGGLLRYGIPDFKMEKSHIDRRVEQMKAEGVVFRTGVMVGELPKDSKVTNWAKETVTPEQLQNDFDAVLLTGGSEQSRDLPVPGRDLDGIHFAMEFLPQQNKVNAGDKLKGQLRADGKHVIVIGGGDTGSDCVGTSNRHGAVSVTQFEVMPQPPEVENKPLVWPYWPLKLRTSSSHEEGCTREFAISTKAFKGEKGKVTGLTTVHVEMKDGKLVEIPGTEKDYKADMVLLAMGFVNPVASILDGFGVEKDARGNAKASTDFTGGYVTNVPKVFVAGDMRRGQSLVVWAIREGRQAARSVDEFLMGFSDLPR